ncbi:hypothetical protein [Glycomyces paridis]|uniref:DUF4064 domain-containing protein n=1 Tax=Glycomyces paridis TaxID=2126555 RepID=A0A4S8PHR4_9ACTN|nr:hypothetical protein [Glycomyces paridis]THV28942.1 hypothetical protein E9998_09280 [Glycomyces paridis]
MLPQPNFGPDRSPVEPDLPDPDAPPRKLRRLQIAMWIQVVSAIVAGNLFAFAIIQFRSASLADIEILYEDADYIGPGGTAQSDYDYYQSSGFLVPYLTIAAIILVTAIVAAMCAIRFKSRLKVVRWTAAVATAILFVVAMLLSSSYGILVAPWVFSAVLALWWLFSSDLRRWLNRSSRRAEKVEETED